MSTGTGIVHRGGALRRSDRRQGRCKDCAGNFRSYSRGFSIRISPRSTVSPGLTVNSLRTWAPCPLLTVEKSLIRYIAPGISDDHGEATLGVGERVVPVVLAVDIGEEVGVGRQLGLFLRAPPAVYARAGRGDELELASCLVTGLPSGPTNRSLGPAAGLQADHQILAGLLAGDVDRRAPLVLRVEDMRSAWTPRGPGRGARSGRRGP